MNAHTYSIIRYSVEFNLEWTGNAHETYAVRCSCGVESGASYSTEKEAHNEQIHTYALNSNRRLGVAKFDGKVINRYYTEGCVIE